MRLLFVGLVLVCGLLGCAGSDDEARIQEADLGNLVLQPEDLTGPWLLFDEGPQVPADAPSGTRADQARFGRVAGWKSRYRRSGAPETKGPLVVESRVDLFPTRGDAEDDLSALEDDLEAGHVLGPGERVEIPTLGDESLAATLHEGEGAAALRYFVIAWRVDGVMATVLVNGFAGGTELSDALALARKQQRRLEAALAE